ncbi:MAG: hypothetical protein M3157_07065 [Actinomycetota bacterium]|nr:hypothetical protein [Actinomycetota bacterium]
MYRKSVLVLVSVLTALVLAGCAEEQPESNTSGETASQGGGQATEETTSGTTSGGTTVAGGTTLGGTTMAGATTAGTTFGGTTVQGAAGDTTGGEVAVGGFAVETPNAPDTTIPEVSASRQDVQEYLNQVRPIVEDSVRDISNLVQPEARVENGNVTLDVEVGSLEEARNAVSDGLDELRNLDPPQGLEPINEQLIQSFERVQPAYDEIIEAANSGDAGRISDAIQENLPRIERFNAEARAILQDLEQAAGTQQ